VAFGKHARIRDKLKAGECHFLDRIFRSSEQPFGDYFTRGKPAVPQVEGWSKQEGIELLQGWKVEVAKRVKQAALNKGIQLVEPVLVERWVRLLPYTSKISFKLLISLGSVVPYDKDGPGAALKPASAFAMLGILAIELWGE